MIRLSRRGFSGHRVGFSLFVIASNSLGTVVDFYDFFLADFQYCFHNSSV